MLAQTVRLPPSDPLGTALRPDALTAGAGGILSCVNSTLSEDDSDDRVYVIDRKA